jgi:surfeit locus 1 family protein
MFLAAVGRRRFVPALAAVAVIAVTVSLGNWQMRRAQQKEALQQRFDAVSKEPPVNLGAGKVDAEQLDLRRVTVRGTWLADDMVLLDNRVHHGVAGYHVLMPLRIEGAQVCVVVNRGWVGASPDRAQLPQVPTPTGVVTVEGVSRVARGGAFQLEKDSSTGRVWQTLSIERFRDWSKLDVQPIVVEQTSPADDRLIREWAVPYFGIDKHRGYAFQWYALAAVTAVLYLGLSLRGAKRRSE